MQANLDFKVYSYLHWLGEIEKPHKGYGWEEGLYNSLGENTEE